MIFREFFTWDKTFNDIDGYNQQFTMVMVERMAMDMHHHITTMVTGLVVIPEAITIQDITAEEAVHAVGVVQPVVAVVEAVHAVGVVQPVVAVVEAVAAVEVINDYFSTN